MTGTTNEPGQHSKESDNVKTLLFSLMRLTEAKNSYTGLNDTARLVKKADIFGGRSLGRFSPEELLALRNACVLPDIGNLGIPDSILLKPGSLTEEEWTIMRSVT